MSRGVVDRRKQIDQERAAMIQATKQVIDAMRKFRERFGFSQEQLARILGVTGRTVHRWEALEADPSGLARQQLERLIELVQLADSLFGKEANVWWEKPNPTLQKKSPKDVLLSPHGLEDVRSVLGRIEWGIST